MIAWARMFWVIGIELRFGSGLACFGLLALKLGTLPKDCVGFSS